MYIYVILPQAVVYPDALVAQPEPYHRDVDDEEEEMDEAEVKLLLAIRCWARKQKTTLVETEDDISDQALSGCPDAGRVGGNLDGHADDPEERSKPYYSRARQQWRHPPFHSYKTAKRCDARAYAFLWRYLAGARVATPEGNIPSAAEEDAGAEAPSCLPRMALCLWEDRSEQLSPNIKSVPETTCMMPAAANYGEDAVSERGVAAGPNHGASAATAPSPEGDDFSQVVAGGDLELRRGSDPTCMTTAAANCGEDAVVERGVAAGPNHGASAATAPSPEGDDFSQAVAGGDLEPRRGSDLTCMTTAAANYGEDAVVVRGVPAVPKHGAPAATAPSPEGDKSAEPPGPIPYGVSDTDSSEAIRRWARRQTIAMPHSSGEAGGGITNVAPHEYGQPGLAPEGTLTARPRETLSFSWEMSSVCAARVSGIVGFRYGDAFGPPVPLELATLATLGHRGGGGPGGAALTDARNNIGGEASQREMRRPPELAGLVVTEITDVQYREGTIQATGPARPLLCDNPENAPQAIAALLGDDQKFVPLRTAGDGGCGAHAPFGRPTAEGFLCEDARRKAAAALTALHDGHRSEAAPDHFRQVFEGLWQEHGQPGANAVLQGGTAEPEAQCLWRHLPERVKQVAIEHEKAKRI